MSTHVRLQSAVAMAAAAAAAAAGGGGGGKAAAATIDGGGRWRRKRSVCDVRAGSAGRRQQRQRTVPACTHMGPAEHRVKVLAQEVDGVASVLRLRAGELRVRVRVRTRRRWEGAHGGGAF